MVSIDTNTTTQSSLRKTLGPIMLWGLGVGYVISGMYFGWNLGLPEGGPYGFLIATLIVTLMYVSFVLSYAELSCAIPKAGGAFDYAHLAFGPSLGFLAGISQCIEFIFAPPAIAAAIGAYFNLFFPQLSSLWIGCFVYLLFTGLNIYGVKQSAIFELLITIFAVAGLFIFAGITLPHFSWNAFSINALPHGWMGILPALPYAIWFYLGIEGLANTAEESKNPQKDISNGFLSAMVTLIILVLLTFFSSVGIGGWQSIVYQPGSLATSDSPLPLALAQVMGQNNFLYHLLITISLFGLIASFHGIILVAGRATFEFGRIGYIPKIFGTTLENRKTPATALILNLFLGLSALLTGKTSQISIISVFGALTMYLISLASLLKLRKVSPTLNRPYKTPLYPWTPLISFILSALSLAAMTYYNWQLALVYLGIILGCYGYFYLVTQKKTEEAVPLKETTVEQNVS